MKTALLVMAFAGVSLAAGSPKVSLRQYNAPTIAGWEADWAFDDGTTSTVSVRSVAIVEGEKRVLTRTDHSDGSAREAELVYHDGFTRYGTETAFDIGGGGVLLPPMERRLNRLHPLDQWIGRTYRSSVIRGDILDLGTGERIGRFVRRERASLRRFEDKTTPGGSYGAALVQEWTVDTRTTRDGGGRRGRVIATGTRWFALGQGPVAQEARVVVQRDGYLDSDSGLVRGWRVSLTVPPGTPFDIYH